ncbi:MAG: hypothetical protein A3A51_01465 [Candidatus Levybacteria bacterium RIFCSPLOWO2_01_FULL_39_10]|nr:MAG: hypothetical protein A3A51_01465 [Candidatus Levybacteria bacterium RIFCSPLOWO2_01_FULL_39_10]
MKFKHVSFLLFIIIAVEIIFLVFTYYLNQKTEPQSNLTSSPPEIQTPINKSMVVRAAIPYWDQENAIRSFKENTDLIDIVSVFWYYIDENGKINKYEYANEDESLIEFAHQNDIKVSAVLTNLGEFGDFDSTRVENVIKDEESISNHINDIKKLLEDKSFDGITIDYESVDSSQEQKFSDFIKKLSEELGEDGKYVEVALHPKENFSAQRKYAYQDWEEIAKYADRIYIMAYGQYTDEEDSGPIASIDWVSQILSYAKNQDIPNSKLYLGIPLYGYDWDKNSEEDAEGLTFQDISNLLLKEGVIAEWDENAKSPHFSYGGDHEVWFEDGRSVEEKIKLAKKFNLAGITFWRLGGEDPKVWDVIKKYRKN